MHISVLSEQTGVATHRLRRYKSLGWIRSEQQANGYCFVARAQAQRLREMALLETTMLNTDQSDQQVLHRLIQAEKSK